MASRRCKKPLLASMQQSRRWRRCKKASVGGDSTGNVRSAINFNCFNKRYQIDSWRLMPSNNARVGGNALDQSQEAAMQLRSLRKSRQCSDNAQCSCVIFAVQSCRHKHKLWCSATCANRSGGSIRYGEATSSARRGSAKYVRKKLRRKRN